MTSILELYAALLLFVAATLAVAAGWHRAGRRCRDSGQAGTCRCETRDVAYWIVGDEEPH